MKIEIKNITPEWAQQTLDSKNTRNRTLNQRHVDRLAEDIKSGRWKLNGDAIRLSETQLIDGQHRLAAIVAAGVEVQSLVIECLPDDVFDTIDIGKRRSGADTLSVLGEKNCTRLASALPMVHNYYTGRLESGDRFSNSQLESLLAMYPDIRNSLQHRDKGSTLMAHSVMDSCHYIFSRIDPVLADEFVDKIIHGEGLAKGDPWHMLRERLVSNYSSKSKLHRRYIMALCIKAWNCVRRGERPGVLKYTETGRAPESFPIAE